MNLALGSVSFPWLMSARSPQNQVDTLNLPFQCRVNLASHREVAVRISGVMRLENLHAVSVRPLSGGACLFQISSGFVKPLCLYLCFSSNLGSSNWWRAHQWSSPPPAPCSYLRRDPSDM